MTTTVDSAPAQAVASGKKKSKKKLVIIALVALLAAGGGYTFLMPAKKPAATATKPAPKPGPLVSLDAVTVNLAGGHYLRVGVALQFTDKVPAAGPPDGSAAQDQIITYLTGQSPSSLETPAGLATVKAALLTRIAAVYPRTPLMGVLLTSFVIQ